MALELRRWIGPRWTAHAPRALLIDASEQLCGETIMWRDLGSINATRGCRERSIAAEPEHLPRVPASGDWFAAGVAALRPTNY